MPIAFTSVRIIGAVSIMSSAFPAGGPSRMSVNTTSASSMSAMRCAVVEPTNPPPTTVTFFLLIFVVCPLLFRYCHAFHIFNDRGRERRRANLGRARHEAFKVIRHFLLLNRPRNAVFNQLCGLCPSLNFEHHGAREHHR